MNDEEKKVFSKMAKKRWDSKTPQEKSEEMKRIRRMGIEKQQALQAKLASLTAK